MTRSVGFLSSGIALLVLATMAPAEQAGTGSMGFAGQHTMTGTVTAIDKTSGEVTIQTEGKRLALHFPTSALQTVERGDVVTVQLAIREGTAPGATSGAPPMPRTPGTPGMEPGTAGKSGTAPGLPAPPNP